MAWIEKELPAKTREQIAQRLPDLPIGLINHHAMDLFGNWEAKPEMRSKPKPELQSLHRKATGLNDLIFGASTAANDLLQRYFTKSELEILTMKLTVLARAAEAAGDTIEGGSKGRNYAKQSLLAMRFAAIFNGIDMTANDSRNGDLVWLINAVLEGIGKTETIEDSRNHAKAGLKLLGNN